MFGVVLAPRGCTYTGGVGDWDRSPSCIWERETERTMRVLCLDGAGLGGPYVCLSVDEGTIRMYGGGTGAVSGRPSASTTVNDFQPGMHLCHYLSLPVGTPDTSTQAGAHEEETLTRWGSAGHKDQTTQLIYNPCCRI